MSKPVALEKLWRTWPRVARPYACKSCGQEYAAALHPEVDDTTRTFGDWSEDRRHWKMTRYNDYLWCRNPDCSRFCAYGTVRPMRNPAALLGLGKLVEMRPTPAPRLPMRRKWLAMPAPANGPAYEES